MIKPVQRTFKASEGGFVPFFGHNLLLRSIASISQMLPVDLEEKIVCFQQDVHYIQLNGDFSYKIIPNMDVFFLYSSIKAID